MNPFELPPSTPPVSFEPPRPRRRRGVMAGVAFASAGLVAAGVAVVGSMASADDPSMVPAAAASDETLPDSAPATTVAEEPVDADAETHFDGKVVIDVGEGDPIEIDLGNLPDFEELQDCLGLPRFDDFPRPDLNVVPRHRDGGRVFGESHVVVAGPDGVSVVDFGDGDGSVTITKTGDDVTVETDGDVSVMEPGRIDVADLGELPDLPEIPDLELPDPARIQECLDQTGV